MLVPKFIDPAERRCDNTCLRIELNCPVPAGPIPTVSDLKKRSERFIRVDGADSYNTCLPMQTVVLCGVRKSLPPFAKSTGGLPCFRMLVRCNLPTNLGYDAPN